MRPNQIGLNLKEETFDISALTTMELIFLNTKEGDPLRTIADTFDAQLDALPDLPDEAAPNYWEVERHLCSANDALEADFLDALLIHFGTPLGSNVLLTPPNTAMKGFNAGRAARESDS